LVPTNRPVRLSLNPCLNKHPSSLARHADFGFHALFIDAEEKRAEVFFPAPKTIPPRKAGQPPIPWFLKKFSGLMLPVQNAKASPPSPSALIDRACPVCGAREHRPHLVKGPLRLVRCARCAMLYATPVDAALVAGDFYEAAGHAYYTSPAKLAGDFAPARFRREVKLLRQWCPRGRVLDVGCGTGAFLQQLRRSFPQDYVVMGLDVSGPALAHAASLGLATSSAPFVSPDFSPEPFDAITFWAVLEHVAEPLSFLRKAALLLRPRGLAFVLVPNMRSLAVRLLGARYRYVMPEHINCFTAASLRQLAGAVPELAVVKLTSTHFNPVVIGQDFLRRRDSVPEAERARLLNRTNAWKTSGRLRPLQLAYAGTEQLLGRLGLADNLLLLLQRQAL
jgi:SAM-dependent methyltransferase